MASPLAYEKHWADKSNCDSAEKKYYEYLAQLSQGKKPECPNVVQKAAAPVTKPKPTAVSNKKEQSPPKAVAAPTPVAAAESDQNKVKKDKRKNKKNKGKDVSQSPDPASSATESVKEQPKASPLVAAPVAPAATEDASKEQTKKKMSSLPAQCTLASEISKARQHIKNSLERMDGIAALAASPGAELLDRLSTVEKENEKLRSVIDGLNNLVIDLHARVKTLESGSAPASKATAPAPAKKAPAPAAEDDDDVDLFGSEDEDEDKAAAELREKRLAEYAAKKSKKPALIAKSNVILDIKPWDDETDMKQMELEVRKVTMDGLLLGASKLVPLAYGIHKLQMSCVIEDDKVSVDELQEKIEQIEDYVQSVDIAAFNKI
ncbi:probable elongation factor 1-delta isoform X2 [Ochlerotatus camptorhynchus]|uniref:probable elongation factor 1-delta isoform X2 n=1 Tax=Ochlerotatus camptorhynchus TaxID=644619 RepID=UPI0031D06AA2